MSMLVTADPRIGQVPAIPAASERAPFAAAPPGDAPLSVERTQAALSAEVQANQNRPGLLRSMAALRLKSIQAVLRALQLFGNDPQLVAKRAAQLARQLRAAIQDYSATGGDPAAPEAQAPAGTPNTPDLTFAADAGATLDALRATVARDRPHPKGGDAPSSAFRAFDDAAAAAGDTLEHSAGQVNMLI